MSRVQSIERAFAVLGALADGPSGVTDVADRVALPKSTVARLLGSLTREGAVEQVPGETRYRLGTRLGILASGLAGGRDIVSVARPHLEALAAELRESAGLSVPDGAAVLYVDQVEAANEVRIRDWTGTRVPLHAVSSGLVVLAHMAPRDLDAFLARPLERFTDRTVTDPAAIRERLDRIRAGGYAWVHEEFAEGLNSVAAAVEGEAGPAVGAVHVHGPSYRFPVLADSAAIGRRVATAAAAVSARLSG
ncbi:MAG TPA: IclR family transcriptional regulator [Candidatus Limnocylindrales bacterium]|nr:IclR family transcriptional regulator [Candidatus Limnocylindrales bacterium]